MCARAGEQHPPGMATAGEAWQRFVQGSSLEWKSVRKRRQHEGDHKKRLLVGFCSMSAGLETKASVSLNTKPFFTKMWFVEMGH